MKIKLTKQQSIIIITITTLLLIIGLYFIFKTPKKPISTKTFNYDKTQTYEHNLERWKNQCDFKSGQTYDANYIREKLGRSDKKVYCLDNGDIEVFHLYYPSFRKTIYAYYLSPNYQLDYKYVSGYTSDDWYFTRYDTTPSYFPKLNASNSDIFLLGSTLYTDQIKFNTYVDTTPPPNPSDYGL